MGIRIGFFYGIELNILLGAITHLVVEWMVCSWSVAMRKDRYDSDYEGALISHLKRNVSATEISDLL